MRITIDKLSTTAGYLENTPIAFAEGLTCIIGARGTCKSTIVETLRFAFNHNPERVATLMLPPGKGQEEGQASRGLIHETLGSGSVTCSLTDHNSNANDPLTIDRHVATSSRIYRDGIIELKDRSLLNCIEIYSQGDLQRIAERDELRLELIDRPKKAEIEELQRQRLEHGRALRDIGVELRRVRGEIEIRRTDLRGLEHLRDQLAAIVAEQPTLSRELDSERSLYLERKQQFDYLVSAVGGIRASLDFVHQSADETSDLIDLSHKFDQIPFPETEELASYIQMVSSFVERTKAECKRAQSVDVSVLLKAIEDRCSERDSQYFRLRQDEQVVSEILRRQDALKQQIDHLGKVEDELASLQREESQILQLRHTHREALQRIGDQIFRYRLSEVDSINQQHGEVVVLSMEQGARTSDYARKLISLLQGSRLRGQDDVAEEVARRVRPSELLDIVEAGDAQRLSGLLDRDLGQMARLVSFLMDSNDLYELEGIAFEDKLEITMYVDGVAKPIGQLSRGQMATALLPLILRPAPYPLIVDQPEDDLDNRFIYTTLVKRVRELKSKRQLIFVTHNANIPVLGDADAVVVMRMGTPTKAAPAETGNVDEMKEHILSLLEGGADAFQLRHAKYLDLLS